MLQKIELQQLRALSIEEIKSYEQKVVERNAELEDAKAKGGKAWYPALQDELNDIAILLVDVEETIDEKLAGASEKTSNAKYVPAKGTEKMVHLSIVRGRRFNPNTGKEQSKPFIQIFTFSEWQVFKNNFKGLGYFIIEALHDPYGDAAELVVKE